MTLLPECQKSVMIINSFRNSTGIAQTDRTGKTILHSACIDAC